MAQRPQALCNPELPHQARLTPAFNADLWTKVVAEVAAQNEDDFPNEWECHEVEANAKYAHVCLCGSIFKSKAELEIHASSNTSSMSSLHHSGIRKQYRIGSAGLFLTRSGFPTGCFATLCATLTQTTWASTSQRAAKTTDGIPPVYQR